MPELNLSEIACRDRLNGYASDARDSSSYLLACNLLHRQVRTKPQTKASTLQLLTWRKAFVSL
jgi:hypothetical protein